MLRTSDARTGVRAHERRADPRAYNRRLLDYAEEGGTVIVPCNRFQDNPGDKRGSLVEARVGKGAGCISGSGCGGSSRRARRRRR